MKAFHLHLLRHGEPSLSGRMLGSTDCAPTDAGIGVCMDRVSGLEFEAIVSSDLSRARLAAEAIGEVHKLPNAIDPRWRELDFGEWDGLFAAEIAPDDLARFWEDPDANPPPRGERWSNLVERVSNAIIDLPQCTTLVVTHGGAMRAALAYLCGFELKQTWAFDLSYSSLLSLKVWRDHSSPQKMQGQIKGLLQ